MKRIFDGGYNEEDIIAFFNAIIDKDKYLIEDLLNKDKSLSGTPYNVYNQELLSEELLLPLQLATYMLKKNESDYDWAVKVFEKAKMDLQIIRNECFDEFTNAERYLRVSAAPTYHKNRQIIEEIIDLIKLYNEEDGRHRKTNKLHKKVNRSRSRRNKQSTKRKRKRKSRGQQTL